MSVNSFSVGSAALDAAKQVLKDSSKLDEETQELIATAIAKAVECYPAMLEDEERQRYD